MSGSLSDYRPNLREAETVFYLVEGWLKSMGVKHVALSGSFGRRWANRFSVKLEDSKETVGDVDIVVRAETLSHSLNVLETIGRIFGTAKNGASLTKGLIGRIQVDIWVTEGISEFVACHEFFLLPKSLQISVRAITASRGLKFSYKGLFDRETNRAVLADNRADLYKHMGIDPISPSEMIRAESYKIEV
jgi:DNA polymerase/3'-5' exonuclease PolX